MRRFSPTVMFGFNITVCSSAENAPNCYSNFQYELLTEAPPPPPATGKLIDFSVALLPTTTTHTDHKDFAVGMSPSSLFMGGIRTGSGLI